MNNPTSHIAVLGSINMDLVIRCAFLPEPGQTVLADSAAEICGGKGANQAVAAARAGGNVTMIGRVGDDGFSARLVANLKRENIDCDWIRSTPNSPSGLAMVLVEDSGQNSIIVVPGANAHVSVADVETARSVIERSDILLIQLELPIDTVLAGIRIAAASNTRVILDPAPAPTECPEELLHVDLICPNECEAAAIAETVVESMEQVEAAARELHLRGARHVAITLGERGTLLWDGEQATHVAPFPVTAVDTTAAGDAFAGALAVSWTEGNSLLDAVTFSNAAGALAASREGAQPSMVMRNEIESLWRTRP